MNVPKRELPRSKSITELQEAAEKHGFEWLEGPRDQHEDYDPGKAFRRVNGFKMLRDNVGAADAHDNNQEPITE
jgi:hypothetical protein